MCVCSVTSVVSNSVTLWTVTCQASLSMRFSRQECWSGLPCPPSGDLPYPGMEPRILWLLHCRWILYPLSHLGSPLNSILYTNFSCHIRLARESCTVSCYFSVLSSETAFFVFHDTDIFEVPFLKKGCCHFGSRCCPISPLYNYCFSSSLLLINNLWGENCKSMQNLPHQKIPPRFSIYW